MVCVLWGVLTLAHSCIRSQWPTVVLCFFWGGGEGQSWFFQCIPIGNKICLEFKCFWQKHPFQYTKCLLLAFSYTDHLTWTHCLRSQQPCHLKPQKPFYNIIQFAVCMCRSLPLTAFWKKGSILEYTGFKNKKCRHLGVVALTHSWIRSVTYMYFVNFVGHLVHFSIMYSSGITQSYF